MKPIQKKFLLFDADHTLLDFRTSEKKALTQTFAEYGLPFPDAVYQQYQIQNTKLWQDYEKGMIDRQTVLHTRFGQLFRHFGYKADGAAFEDSYRAHLDRACDLMPDALEVVAQLSQTHALYIVTNGVVSTQKMRLRDSGLAPYFRAVFTSEEIGCQKPQKAFFDQCFARIPDFAKEATLIIGDSLTSDIRGGNLAGIETCWFNPEGKAKNTDATVDYEIRSLRELPALLR